MARTFKSRLVGLLRGSEYPLVLPHCFAIHTFGMKEALHLLWLDKNNRIIRKDLNVKSHRIQVCLKANSVVEFCSSKHPATALEHYKSGDFLNLLPQNEPV